MDFREVSEVVPWIELAADLDQDLEAEQVAAPRAFKTHCWFRDCPYSPERFGNGEWGQSAAGLKQERMQ